jgi:uncharacterized protein (TIGR02266 family)
MTDTRKDKRAPLSLKVRFKSATLDEFVEQYSQDLSRGGIFIKSKKPMKIGTLLKFEFQLKDESSLIHGVGRVVWVRAPEEATDASPAGMGIKFIKMDADSRALVQDIVDRRGGGSGAFEAGETGADAGDEGGSFFPDSGPAQLPPPEDRTSVRHASEFLAEALMGAGVSAADEAKESAEEARRRGAEIQKKREEEAKAREAAAAAAAKRAAEVPKGSASTPASDEEAKPRRAAPAEVTGTDEIPTLIASRAELDAVREEAENATTLAEEPKAKAAPKESPKDDAKAAPKEEPRAAAKEPAKVEPAKEPAKPEPAKATTPKKDETPRLVMPNEPDRPPPPKEPSSMPIVVVVLVLVALGVGGWFFFLRDSGEAEPTTPVAQPEPTPEPTPEPIPEVEPEPEPEPVATTRVRVTSTPEAEIFVGGTSVGTTTADGLEIELPIGVASTVEARAAGFGSSSLEVTPAEGTEPDPITFRLAALPYVIEITTEPSGARVSANNRNLQSPGEVRLERWTRDVSVFANLTGYNQGSQVVRQTDFVERDGAMRATVRIVLEARATVVPSMTATMVAVMTETTETAMTETAMTEAPAMTEEPAMVEEPPAMVEEPPAMVEAPPPAMTEEPVPDNPF